MEKKRGDVQKIVLAVRIKISCLVCLVVHSCRVCRSNCGTTFYVEAERGPVVFTFKESREEKDVERKEERGEKRRGVMRMERSKKWRGEKGKQTRGYRRRGKRVEKRENMKVDLGWKQ